MRPRLLVVPALVTLCFLLSYCSWVAQPPSRNHVANTPGTVIPEELRPGMTGFCLSPDEKGVDRITLVIVGVQKYSGYQAAVIARITSGRAFAGGAAYGMSGSPVYLDDGRLIGALARTFIDPDKTILITPIREMLAHGRNAHAGDYTGVVPAIPSYAAFCTVWGDATRCSYATLTFVQDGIAYATGHGSIGDGAQSASHQVAVFGASVIMTVKGTPPNREAGTLGNFLGTLVWDGANASVIQLGQRPSHFPVRLILPHGPVRTLFGIRRNSETPGGVAGLLAGIIQEQMDMGRGWDARITVSFLDGSADLVFQDEWTNALKGLKEFLDPLLAQSPEALGSIAIDLRAMPDAGEYELKKFQIKKRHANLWVEVSLSGMISHQRIVIEGTLPLSLRPQKGLGWYLGRTLQTKTLESMPALSAIAVLNRCSDRRGIYLACVECETSENLVQVGGKLHLNNLLVSKAETMPMSIGEQEPEKPVGKK